MLLFSFCEWERERERLENVGRRKVRREWVTKGRKRKRKGWGGRKKMSV